MRKQIDNDFFTNNEYQRFQTRLRQQLAVLADMVKTPGFGGDIYSFGCKLKVYIIDDDGLPDPINKSLLAEVGDPRLRLELNKYNLQYNLSPVNTTGKPFSAIENEVKELHDAVDNGAQSVNAQVVPIGILPTLTKNNIAKESLTDLPRFRVPYDRLLQLRGKPFRIHIDGKNPLTFFTNDLTLEGANNSFDFHLRTPLKHYCNTWNAIQLATPMVLALAANSPTLFGHSLWQETRIALYQHSVDNRQRGKLIWRRPERFSYGHGWLRAGPWESFAENVGLYEPVMPVSGYQDSAETLSQGDIPFLDELRLHQSTVWSWNRAVYDPNLGGHFRIECRALPAGPTTVDMTANAALLIGLAIGLREDMPNLVPVFPFMLAEYNFYRAAQHGLDAKILWPETTRVGPTEHPVTKLLDQMLPIAEKGLQILDVEQDEINNVLGNIQNRIDRKITGSTWQNHMLTSIKQKYNEKDALPLMLKRYLAEMHNGHSVVDWNHIV